MLTPMIKSIDEAYPDYIYGILQNYFTNVYVDQNVPAIWIEELCRKIKFKWKKPYDGYSSESTNED